MPRSQIHPYLMKTSIKFIVSAQLMWLGASAMAQTLPEPPAIWREVTGVRHANPGNANNPQPQHYRAHVQAFRTSNDGRVAMRVLPTVDFTLMIPEKLSQNPLLNTPGLSAANSTVMSATAYSYAKDSTGKMLKAADHAKLFSGGLTKGSIVHSALFDPFDATGSLNPRAVGGDDVYDLVVVAIFNMNNGNLRLVRTPVTITVQNPKTVNASIKSVEPGTSTTGPLIQDVGGKEPTIIGGDGRLLVWRLGNNARTWRNPNTGAMMPSQAADIVYSYYDDSAETCDVSKWTAENMVPISFAPIDTRINTKFGFARNRFRDAQGNEITPGKDIGGTYPWMDRNGKNLFFTAIPDTLYTDRTQTLPGAASRYPTAYVAGETQTDTTQIEASDATRGICFAGLWSHGKIVLLDNLTNDMDYAVSEEDMPVGSQRMVKLFQGPGNQATQANGWLRLGAGRVNSAAAMPAMENRNSTIMESLENRFNYRKHARPLGLRDVMWQLNNGKQNDVVAFDDYTDPDVFINCSMAGLLRWDSSVTTSIRDMFYDSGWNGTAFTNEVRLQNAATAPVARWKVPAHGAVMNHGSSKGRLEPAATGGIHGKGFWMDGSIGLAFTVPVAQPQSLAARDWYAGLFVDCRHLDDTANRVLLTFPDQSAICLNGRSQIQYFRASSSGTTHTIPLPAINPNSTRFKEVLPQTGWAHLAWQVLTGGTEIEFLVNGLVYDRFVSATPIFQLAVPGATTDGVLTVGKSTVFTNAGFKGWIDDFKVIARKLDPETACNHAGGTLIGLPAGYTGEHAHFANWFPASTHQAISNRLHNSGETAYAAYANHYDHGKDNGAYLGNLPVGTASLRDAIHFPEGPFYHNAPRPDSTQNQFCITCHSAPSANENTHTVAFKNGLTIEALMLRPVNAVQDLRRLPSQPPAVITGNVIAGMFDFITATPGSAAPAPQPLTAPAPSATGYYIDQWLLPTFTTAVVKTFTLVNASTGEELSPIFHGSTISLASYPGIPLAIRANLESAVGSVTLTLDGGSAVTRDRIPYTSAAIPTTGQHIVTATPSLGANALMITFTINP